MPSSWPSRTPCFSSGAGTRTRGCGAHPGSRFGTARGRSRGIARDSLLAKLTTVVVYDHRRLQRHHGANLLWRDSRADERLPWFGCSAGKDVPGPPSRGRRGPVRGRDARRRRPARSPKGVRASDAASAMQAARCRARPAMVRDARAAMDAELRDPRPTVGPGDPSSDRSRPPSSLPRVQAVSRYDRGSACSCRPRELTLAAILCASSSGSTPFGEVDGSRALRAKRAGLSRSPARSPVPRELSLFLGSLGWSGFYHRLGPGERRVLPAHGCAGRRPGLAAGSSVADVLCVSGSGLVALKEEC
jgi:hypothetical protein